MNNPVQLIEDRLNSRGVYNVMIARTTTGEYYVFSNANLSNKMLEGWGVSIELAIEDAFTPKTDILEDLLS